MHLPVLCVWCVSLLPDRPVVICWRCVVTVFTAWPFLETVSVAVALMMGY